MIPKITVAPLTAAHLPAMIELELQSFADPWTEEALAGSLTVPVMRGLGAFDGDALVGFVLAYVIPPEGEIADLCVAPAARGKGIATLLMRAILDADDCTDCFLEVRMSNTPARRLYEKLGFRAIGLRKHYYEHPKEDALVMRRHTDDSPC